MQHKKAQSLPFAIKQCINKNTLVVHLRYFHQWDFFPSSVLTRKQWSETQISGWIPVVSSPSPCPSKSDIKWPFKANLAAYACTESPAITPKCSLHHLDSCKVFLFGRQGTFVDITSRLVERKPGWTLCLQPPTGTAAWFSWVSGGRQERSFIRAALGTLNRSQTTPRGDTSTSSEQGPVRLTRLGRSVLTRLNRLCCSDHLCAVAPCLVKTHRLLEPFPGHLCYQPHHHIRAAQQLDSSGGLVHTSISVVDHQSHTDLEQPWFGVIIYILQRGKSYSRVLGTSMLSPYGLLVAWSSSSELQWMVSAQEDGTEAVLQEDGKTEAGWISCTHTYIRIKQYIKHVFRMHRHDFYLVLWIIS